MVDQAGGGAAQLHSAPGAWGAGQGQGHRRPFLGRGAGASLGVEVQVDVEVGVEEGVEEEEVVVEVVQVVTSPSWPSSWARGEGGWRRWRGRWEVEVEEVEGGSITPSSWEGFTGSGSR